jgi:SAM-dependent methyltransferase
METLIIPESEIRRYGPGHVLAVCWRQWRTERALAKGGIRFRDTDPGQVAAAYAAMTPAEFEAINGRQDWANWRTIPRALSGHVPERPLRVLDLGCGTGSSTRVLAFYCPAGSHITGYEFAAPLIDVARNRVYAPRSGSPAHVDFVCQSITEPLRDVNGAALPDASVDVVNSSGVVGHHLNSGTVKPLVQEVRRVLRAGGVVLLDSGPTLRPRALRQVMERSGFTFLGHYRSWWLDPTGELAFRKV